MPPVSFRAAWPLVLLALAGCASPGLHAPVASPLGDIDRLTRPHLAARVGGSPLPPQAIAARLQAPLDADAAVQLALQNNPALLARLARLDVSAAEVADAGRLPNPGFRFSRLTRGSEVELERGWQIDLARLLTLPLVRAAEQRRLQAEQQQVAAEVLALAGDTRRAWVRAVSAEEVLRYRKQVMEAAEAGAELAKRMHAAGNFNALARAREQGFEGEARLALALARQQQLATRERLVRLLGLENGTALQLPSQLPTLPDGPRALADAEAQALAQRLDVMAARSAVEQAARQAQLAQTTRFVSMLELGTVRNSSNEQPTQRGWEVALELPLFGPGPLPRAQALARQATHEAADIAIRARSEAREAHGLYLGAFEVARHHRDELMPLAARIADEQLLRYNAMLIGVFELLADARAQVAAVSAAQEALRDFWLAQADLDQALAGPLSTPALH